MRWEDQCTVLDKQSKQGKSPIVHLIDPPVDPKSVWASLHQCIFPRTCGSGKLPWLQWSGSCPDVQQKNVLGICSRYSLLINSSPVGSFLLNQEVAVFPSLKLRFPYDRSHLPPFKWASYLLCLSTPSSCLFAVSHPLQQCLFWIFFICTCSIFMCNIELFERDYMA